MALQLWQSLRLLNNSMKVQTMKLLFTQFTPTCSCFVLDPNILNGFPNDKTTPLYGVCSGVAQIFALFEYDTLSLGSWFPAFRDH